MPLETSNKSSTCNLDSSSALKLSCLFGGFFMMISVILVTVLIRAGELETIPPTDLVLGVNLSKRLVLTRAQYVYIDLSFEEEVSGVFLLSVFDSGSEQDIPADPALTLWERPGSLVRRGEENGAHNLDPLVLFDFSNNFTNTLVAQLSFLGSAKTLEFSLSLTKLDYTQPFPIGEIYSDKVEQQGATFIPLELSKGLMYSVNAQLQNSTVGPFPIVLRLRDSSGLQVDTGLLSNNPTLAGRVIYRSHQTDIFFAEVRGLKNAEIQFSFVTQALDITLTEFIDNEIQLTPNLYTNPSFDIVFNVTTGYQYRFVFKSSLTDQYKSIFRTIDNYSFPAYLPGLSVRLEDYETGDSLHVAESVITYDTIDDVVFAEDEILTFTYKAKTSKQCVLDITSLARDISSDILLGSFDLRIRETKPIVLGEDSDLASAEFVNIYSPYETCDPSPATLTTEGCSMGILLFCRNEIFPYSSFEKATVDVVTDICLCTQFLCSQLRNKNLDNPNLDEARTATFGTLIVICLLCAICGLIPLAELIWFPLLREMPGQGSNMLTWIFVMCFFLFAISFFSLDLSLERFINTFDVLEREYNILLPAISATEDLEFENNFFSYPSASPTSVLDLQLLPPELEAKIPRRMTFALIQLEITLLRVFESLFESFAILSFLETCLHWLVLIPGNTMIERTRRKKVVNRITNTCRVIQVALMVYMILFSITLVRTDAQSFNESLNIILSILSGLTMLGFIGGNSWVLKVLKFNTPTQQLTDMVKLVDRVSLAVLLSCFGVFLSEIYLARNVKNLDDLVEEQNDPNGTALEMFKDVCFVFGIVAVFRYLYETHRTLKRSLVEAAIRYDAEETSFNEDTQTPKGYTFFAGSSAETSYKESFHHLNKADRKKLLEISTPGF